MPHPMQEVIIAKDGIVRFRANEIVRFLLDAGPFDMNKLAVMPFSNEDREQFAQLIGYSVSGAGDLPYVSDALLEKADAEAERLIAEQENT